MGCQHRKLTIDTPCSSVRVLNKRRVWQRGFVVDSFRRYGCQAVKREEERAASGIKRLHLVDTTSLQDCVGIQVLHCRTLAIDA